MTREELIESLCDEDSSFERERLDQLDCHDLANEWLEWNGFIGYIDNIIDVVFAAYQPILARMAFSEIEYDSQAAELAELYSRLTSEQQESFLDLINNTKKSLPKKNSIMTYKVEITETLQRVIEIEAASSEDACNAARQMYKDEEIVLNEDDFSDYEINILE